MKLISTRTQAVIVENLRVANKPWSRICGLLFKPALTSNQGLALIPCNSIHSLGMRYAIDVIYLDKKNRVVKCSSDFKPNSLGPVVFKSRAVIEMPAGKLRGLDIQIGDQLNFV